MDEDLNAECDDSFLANVASLNSTLQSMQESLG